MVKPIRMHWIILLPLILVLLPSNARSKEKPFRPKVGEFPPLEKAHSYKGELTFVDHANRRGSLRIDGDGRFRFAAPSPFALLPYGLVRYHGSPADLRDIPLGTVMIRPATWPVLEVPWEEYINFKKDGIEKRFPTPDIFPEIR